MSASARLGLLMAASMATVILTPFVGVEDVPIDVITRPGGTDAASVIFWQLRVPRVFAAFLAGAALALGGAAFQALFRNPLATPFTLGVASGAAFGVALVSRLGIGLAVAGVALDSVAALAGAMLAVAVVWGLTHLRPTFSTMVLLLAKQYLIAICI